MVTILVDMDVVEKIYFEDYKNSEANADKVCSLIDHKDMPLLVQLVVVLTSFEIGDQFGKFMVGLRNHMKLEEEFDTLDGLAFDKLSEVDK